MSQKIQIVWSNFKKFISKNVQILLYYKEYKENKNIRI